MPSQAHETIDVMSEGSHIGSYCGAADDHLLFHIKENCKLIVMKVSFSH